MPLFVNHHQKTIGEILLKKIICLALCLLAMVLPACESAASSSGSAKSTDSSSGQTPSKGSADSSEQDRSTTATKQETQAPAGDTETDTNTASQAEYDPENYVLPADAVKIDFTKDDPSNDEIKFLFDEEGRVVSYKYSAKGNDIIVTYSYKENKVNVNSFIDDMVYADEEFKLPEYDNNGGFCEYNGYYFKGYSFE